MFPQMLEKCNTSTPPPHTTFSLHQSFIFIFFLVCLKVTKSARCSAARNLTMWHKCDISPTKLLFYKSLKAYWNTFLTQSEWAILWAHGHILICVFWNFRYLPLFNLRTCLSLPFCVLWFKAFVDYLSAVMRQLWLMVAGLISF